MNDLLNDDVLTFLRHADRHDLGPVDAADVIHALRTPLQAAGYTITDAALDVAAAGTGGYTFLVQPVGYWVCRVAGSEQHLRIDEAAATAGVQAARRQLGSLVHEPALRDLSEVDRRFLSTMAQDDGPSRMADIAERMKVAAHYLSQYRRRLIAADLIYPTTRGSVDFTLPDLREYLREHAASTDLEPEKHPMTGHPDRSSLPRSSGSRMWLWSCHHGGPGGSSNSRLPPSGRDELTAAVSRVCGRVPGGQGEVGIGGCQGVTVMASRMAGMTSRQQR